MAMGRQGPRQAAMILSWDELPRSPGHVFYDRLQAVLREATFDAFVEDQCKAYYAPVMGARSLPPGRYFRMHLIGYFEGIDSERGIEWRCADSLSLRDFLGLDLHQRVPDHSWLSRTRARLPLEVHEAVFTWVLERLAERGLVKGVRIGVDASTMEANAAMRSIRRRDTGETYREMLARMAQESGVATPTAAELKQMDRTRKGKRTSNAEWASATDPEARITRMKDGRTRLAYKPEHAVDLDTDAIIAAEIHPADQGDTTTLEGTLEAASQALEAAGVAPCAATPAELVADKGYHSRGVLKDLEGGRWQTRIAEPKPKGVLRWQGDSDARRAVYNNRARLRSGVAKEAFRLRAEKVERSFAHTLDRGGMRRTWLRGKENVHKRYLVHVAGHNLGLVMRLLLGAGTPRWLVARGGIIFWLIDAGAGLVLVLILLPIPGVGRGSRLGNRGVIRREMIWWGPQPHFCNGLLTLAMTGASARLGVTVPRVWTSDKLDRHCRCCYPVDEMTSRGLAPRLPGFFVEALGSVRTPSPRSTPRQDTLRRRHLRWPAVELVVRSDRR
jgi:transposase